ncbi:hypothetical protein [Marinobacter sp. UBA2688]|uniref:hypothetical protein n=1 Tax=Marinobacter sp. UBA2688 TaxID=1946816 RepID=UPI00257EB6D9|nr:hypothetical protein [Marinobacter sp. UBA2688]|tara:strand:- start:6488 stop:7795 length:1308 start_codon:yes stop_codon:yes gene_type:complete
MTTDHKPDPEFVEYLKSQVKNPFLSAATVMQMERVFIDQREKYEAKLQAAREQEGGEAVVVKDAYDGAREDLQIWKKRALESEKLLQEEIESNARLVEVCNDLTGPTHMGEPVLPPRQGAQEAKPIAYTNGSQLFYLWDEEGEGKMFAEREGDYDIALYTHPPRSQGVPDEWLEMLARRAEDSDITYEATYDPGYDKPIHHGCDIEERVADWIRAQKGATPQPEGGTTQIEYAKLAEWRDALGRLFNDYGDCSGRHHVDGFSLWNEIQNQLVEAGKNEWHDGVLPGDYESRTPASQQGSVPEGQIVDCPYACGWKNLQSIITKNAAYFARETIDDDFPEEIRQSGIASGQYALELCRFARRLSAPAAPQADEWVKCADRLPTVQDTDEGGRVWICSPIEAVWLCSFVEARTHGAGWHWKPTGLTRPQPPEQGDGV